MRLADLSESDFKTIEGLAVQYLNEKTRAESIGYSLSSASRARGPKLTAYQVMLNRGFTVEESVEAFKDMCGIVDGVTA